MVFPLSKNVQILKTPRTRRGAPMGENVVSHANLAVEAPVALTEPGTHCVDNGGSQHDDNDTDIQTEMRAVPAA